jgi:hypothetical protein
MTEHNRNCAAIAVDISDMGPCTCQFYVEIRPYTEDESDPGFRRMGPMSERKAEKVDRGVNINLNHKDYYTRIVPA